MRWNSWLLVGAAVFAVAAYIMRLWFDAQMQVWIRGY